MMDEENIWEKIRLMLPWEEKTEKDKRNEVKRELSEALKQRAELRAKLAICEAKCALPPMARRGASGSRRLAARGIGATSSPRSSPACPGRRRSRRRRSRRCRRRRRPRLRRRRRLRCRKTTRPSRWTAVCLRPRAPTWSRAKTKTLPGSKRRASRSSRRTTRPPAASWTSLAAFSYCAFSSMPTGSTPRRKRRPRQPRRGGRRAASTTSASSATRASPSTASQR